MKRLTCVLLLVLTLGHDVNGQQPSSKLTAAQLAALVEVKKLYDKAGRLMDQGKYRELISLHRKALAIFREVFGDKHPNTALALNLLARRLLSEGNYAEAQSCFEQSLAIRKEILGPKHPDTTESLDCLGDLSAQMWDYAAARSYYEQALAIRREVLGDKHPETARSLDNLGSLYRKLGDSAAARPYYEQALAICKEVLGDKHPETATSLNNLGCLFGSMGDYAAARSCLEQALAVNKEVLGDKHPETATSLDNLGCLFESMGNYAAARSCLEQALAINKEVLGKKSLGTAGSLNVMGSFLERKGDYAAARSYYEQALAIGKELSGKKSFQAAESLNDLGHLLQEMGDYAAARSYYEQALAIYCEVFGEKNPASAELLNNLGTLHRSTGNYAAARRYYEQALAINREVLGEKDLNTALFLNNLGVLFDLTGDYAVARPYHEQAQAIRRDVLGDGHPTTAHWFSVLSCREAANGRWNEAARNMDWNRRIVRASLARLLPTLSAKEQADLLRVKDEQWFQGALSLGLTSAAHPGSLSLSAGWLLNGKAVAQEALAQGALFARESTDPAIGTVFKELLGLRRQLATLTLAIPKPGQEEARRTRLEELQGQEETLSRRIAEARGKVLQADTWVEVDAVRKVLPVDAVLVDIARFKVFSFEAKGQEKKWKPARYVAWVVPPTGEQQAIKIIDLGEAEKIDQAVQEVRTAIQAAIGKQGTISQQGEPGAEKLLRQPLGQVAQLVLTPLVNQIGDAKQIVLSPDAALWFVPWGALPLADGRYAIEQYQIRYLVSGRDLVAQRTTTRKANQPIIMADPNYDLSPDEAQATTRAILRGAPAPGSEQLGYVGPMTSASALPKFARLPYTAAEAQLIVPKLQSYADVAPALYTGKNALEGVFKAFKRPRIAVLSTHGFFLEDQQVKHDDRLLASTETRGIALTVDGKPIENPLLRCGLLLAGCNTSGQAQAASGDDGVLTGMEIVGTDLRGTELVVLSACETGVGQVRNGEGVAGLRQAFQLAGAQAVVATLWQVSDRESARLMTTFFDNLAAGQTKPDALRNAQLAMIQYRRDKYAAAHPFFWAAFTITGE